MEGTFDLETALAEASVENEQVADVRQTDTETSQPSESGKTERDSYYADMRRKQELDEIRQQNATLQAQLSRRHKAFENYFDGNDIDELIDAAERQARGVDIDTIRTEREDLAKQSRVEMELRAYRQAEVERVMAEDLRAIQKLDATVTSLEDLPKTFLAMRFNQDAPMSAEERFLASRQIEKRTKTPKPTSSGSMTGTGTIDREFFTSDELDRLTSKDLDNPKIFEKAMKSLAHLK